MAEALDLLAGFAAMKSGGGGGADGGGAAADTGPTEAHVEPELVADGQNHMDSHWVEQKTYGTYCRHHCILRTPSLLMDYHRDHRPAIIGHSPLRCLCTEK